MKTIASGVAGALICMLAGGASASGGWTTLLRPLSYTDLLADGDTVWCASLEGGLLRFTPSTGAFDLTAREPGGLASNRLSALAFDRSRRLWIGTLGSGVSLLAPDRTTWSVLNAFDGLRSDSVNVLEAQGDTVWIGTTRGIALWDGHEIAGTLPDGTNPSPFQSDDVTGLALLAGDLWVATQNGIYRSALASGLTTWAADTAGLPEPNPGLRIDALACDGGTLLAQVFVGTTLGGFDSLTTYRWTAGTGSWSKVPRTLDGRGTGSMSGLWDDDGTIVGACAIGILRWNGAQWVVVNDQIRSVVPRRRQYAVTVDAQGRLIAANSDNFCRESPGAGPWICTLPPGPPGNDVRDLVLEGSRLYMSTENQGIGRYDGVTWKHWVWPGHFDESDTTFRSAASPYGWLVDKDGLKWVGCWDGALERFDDDVPYFKHLWAPDTTCPPICNDQASAHTFVWCSTLDSLGGRWFGMRSPRDEVLPPLGLEYYATRDDSIPRNFNPENNGLRSAEVRALAVSGDGRIWIGYPGQGLQYIDGPPAPGAEPVIHSVPATDRFFIQGIATSGNQVWVATTSEVRRYSSSGVFEEAFTVPAQPSDRAHHPLEVAPDGSVWLGTVNGVRVYEPGGGRQDFNVKNSPLADEDVRALRIDRRTGVVWIGTGGGLNRFDPSYVPPPPPAIARLEVQVYPNPARLTGLGLRLRLAGNAQGYRGMVADLSGRRVRSFAARQNGTVIWDGRDSGGALVKPGIYFVHVEAGGRRAVARIALVR